MLDRVSLISDNRRQMKYRDLTDKWGTQAQIARALGTTRQNVHRWKERIPYEQQVKIEVLTSGELKAKLPKEFEEVFKMRAAA